MLSKRTYIRETSEKLGTVSQLMVLLGVLVAVAIGAVFNAPLVAQIVVASAVLFYVLFVGMKLVLAAVSIRARVSRLRLPAVDDPSLPIYTVFVPLYKEANMLPSLVEALSNLQYPKEKLQVLLLLEDRDEETMRAAETMGLPSFFEIVRIPDIKPYGKPKALNLGLAQARGDLCVIYDAEDRPDPDQLLKAVAEFRRVPENVACLQARLYFWNRETNWLTRFYWMEYIVHFEWVLPGFSKLGLVPPLGGTSNHFKTTALKAVAYDHSQLPKGAEGVGGWDPWNVTEDAELASAFALHGYRVMTFDSVTLEEATANVAIADRQRRRWLKGHLQTGLALTRHPIRAIRSMGFVKWFFFVLQMLGTAVGLVLNPLFWGMTILYFVTRSEFIEYLYPAPVFYTGVALMIGGNLAFILQLVAACNKYDGEHLVKSVVLAFAWWGFMSWSMYNVLIEMAIPSKRHVWHKTTHGHDLHREGLSRSESLLSPSVQKRGAYA